MTTLLIALIAWIAGSVFLSPLLGVLAAGGRDQAVTSSSPNSLGGTNAQPAAEGGTRPVEATDNPRSVLPGASQPAKSAHAPSLPRRW